MVQGSRRTGFTDSALVRQLARMNGADVRESRQSTGERLSQWLGWTDAIALSTALNGNPPAAPAARGAEGGAHDSECARVRAALATAITEDSIFSGTADAENDDFVPATTATADFAPFRQRYLARQQAMEAGIEPLRARLRAALASRSPEMAKLATVDLVMAQALEAREHGLLATVPAALGRHFKRLRAEALAAQDEAAEPDAWLDMFRRDARELLLAELDFRFQPVEGLLEALRQRQKH